jgi:hypothetical protein
VAQSWWTPAHPRSQPGVHGKCPAGVGRDCGESELLDHHLHHCCYAAPSPCQGCYPCPGRREDNDGSCSSTLRRGGFGMRERGEESSP